MSETEDNKGFKVVDRRSEGRDDQSETPAAPTAQDQADAKAAAPPAQPIDFATFVISLASSALIHLGELPGPNDTAGVNLALAKQTIDILGMLAEKTRGNLADGEAELLQHLLYDLRLKFVETRKSSK